MPLRNKLTEEEANELFSSFKIKLNLVGHGVLDWDVSRELTLKEWQEKGFIEESALEKARKYFKALGSYGVFNIPWGQVVDLQEYYEKAIEELLNKIDELT
jgi:hypothetical protein